MTSIQFRFIVTSDNYARTIDTVNKKMNDGTIYSFYSKAILHKTLGSQGGELIAYEISVEINAIPELVAQMAALALFDGDVEFAQRIIA